MWNFIYYIIVICALIYWYLHYLRALEKKEDKRDKLDEKIFTSLEEHQDRIKRIEIKLGIKKDD
jgi:hypothetical protein